MIEVKWRKFHPDARVPEYAHDTDSGADLRFCEDVSGVSIWPGETKLLGTGVGIQLPPGWEAQARPRSGLSSKGVRISLGTIDQGYTGQLLVCAYNASRDQLVIRKGDRIAQLVFTPRHKATFVLVDALEATERGDGGHGSTGTQ